MRLTGIVPTWFRASVTATSLGYMEGVAYHPPANPWPYWTLLCGIMLVIMLDADGPLRAIVMLPVMLVIQDAVSLYAQGSSPVVADWYSAYFGRNLLTMHVTPSGPIVAYFLFSWLSVAATVTYHLMGEPLCRITES